MPFQSGKEWKKTYLPKGSIYFHSNGPNAPRIGFHAWGPLDPQPGEPVIGGEIRRVAQRLIDIVDPSANGAFVPNREKDELMYALQTPEHPRRTRGKRVDFRAAWLPLGHRYLQKPPVKEG